MSDVIEITVEESLSLVEIEVIEEVTETLIEVAEMGAPGIGMPAGGSTGQVLAKKTSTDFDFEWAAAGGGGGGAVDSVNGHVGAVVLTKADLSLGNVDNTADTAKPLSAAQQTALDLKADLVTGKVPASQLPSYVDDVLDYANLAALPVSGEAGKIYVAIDTGKIYRWSGVVYVEISASLAQVNADWTAVGTVAEILNKPASGSGTAFLDFAGDPGSNSASVAVTGQTGILSTHIPTLTFDYGPIDTYSAEEVQFLASLVRLQYSDPVAGSGFTIYAFSLEKIQGRLAVGWRY